MAPRPEVIRLAVFGQPVAQSLSPRIHEQFARQLGLRVEYSAIEAASESFPTLVRELAAEGARGCNVTVPLKRVAWAMAAACSDRAQRAQAANTLVFNADIYADNTDGQGLVDDLRSIRPGLIEGANICLLGAGGAASGILASLLEAKPHRVAIANRTLARADELAGRHADLGRIQSCAYADIGEMAPFDLMINATSLGHRNAAPPLSAAWFAPGALCYDLNYGSAGTPLRRACETAGIAYADGLGMLVNQAALSFALWTGQLPDVAPVLDALRL